MTPPPDDDPPPPPPKRRRKPPKGLEGFDTGYPEDDDTSTSGPTATTAPTSTGPISTGVPAPHSTSTTAPTPSVPTSPASTGPVSSGTPRKAIWSDSAPMPIATTDAASVVVDPALSTPHADVPPEAPLQAGTAVPTEGGDPSTFPVYTPAAETSGAWSPPAAPAQPQTWSTTPASLDRDEPLPVYGTTDLRDAVGAKSKKKKKPKRARTEPAFDDVDDFDGARPRSRKMIVVSAVSLVVGLGVAALVFLGRANSAWYYVACEPDSIVAQQGRSFPPWGETTLGGKQWAAIKIPPEAECIPLETESEAELSDQFRAMLVKRASVLLTAKEVTKTGEAKALLEQALLHARSNTDSARNARTEIQRLLGDVAYWGASLKMRDASKALLEAAKDFDAAAQQRPRHVTDAAAWAEYVRKVVGELESGPAGSSQTFPPVPPPTTDPRTPAPPGVALPVEPDQGSASEQPAAAPPDAGLPTGGVLL